MQPVIKAIIKSVGHNLVWFLVGMLVTSLVVPPLVYGGYTAKYWGRVYPGVKVSGVGMEGMSDKEVVETLRQLERDFVSQTKIQMTIDKTASETARFEAEVDLERIGLEYLTEKTADRVLGYGRTGSITERLKAQWQGLSRGVGMDHEYELNEEELGKVVEEIAEEVDEAGIEPSVRYMSVNGAETVEVFAGEDGAYLDRDDAQERLRASVAQLRSVPILVSLVPLKLKASDEMVELTRERAERVKGKELRLGLDASLPQSQNSWSLKDKELIPLMKVGGGWRRDKIEMYVENLAQAVNRNPQNALFKYENNRVVEFAPGLNGIEVDVEVTSDALEVAMTEMEETETNGEAKVIARMTPPDLKTPDVNDLGIRELLGFGESTYVGSIAGRVHNVALTANKLNGVLIPPGEVFSFNKTVGDISAATGYKSAYIIKDGRTILGDGGGVCQDSTTLFRAVLDAGLPIVERQAHAYRVSYYEQNSKPGFDATVYSPAPDLKFRNDTPGHVLIQTRVDSQKLHLVIELYGTSDGRVAEILNYQQWGAVPAPPPLYEDDPTLAPGVVKQIDWAASGLKVKFDYVVRRGGEVVFEKTFTSNYRPWQAVYLRGV